MIKAIIKYVGCTIEDIKLSLLERKQRLGKKSPLFDWSIQKNLAVEQGKKERVKKMFGRN